MFRLVFCLHKNKIHKYRTDSLAGWLTGFVHADETENEREREKMVADNMDQLHDWTFGVHKT